MNDLQRSQGRIAGCIGVQEWGGILARALRRLDASKDGIVLHKDIVVLAVLGMAIMAAPAVKGTGAIGPICKPVIGPILVETADIFHCELSRP